MTGRFPLWVVSVVGTYLIAMLVLFFVSIRAGVTLGLLGPTAMPRPLLLQNFPLPVMQHLVNRVRAIYPSRSARLLVVRVVFFSSVSLVVIATSSATTYLIAERVASFATGVVMGVRRRFVA